MPVLSVSRGVVEAAKALVIAAVTWKGLRCHVSCSGAVPGLRVDLRTKAADASTSLASPKLLDEDGAASLVVADEDRIGEAAQAVIVDADGAVLAQALTTVGG